MGESDVSEHLISAFTGTFADFRRCVEIRRNLRRILFKATRLPFHRIHFHLVRKGLLRRQNMLPLQVAVHHGDNSLLVCQVTDNHRHGVHPQCLARCQPPVAGDQLIAAVRQRPCQRRREHAGIGNAPHELRHFLVLLHLKGVISKGCEGSQRDCLYPWLFRIEPFLRAHKKLLIPGQPQINQSVVLHRILPFIV